MDSLKGRNKRKQVEVSSGITDHVVVVDPLHQIRIPEFIVLEKRKRFSVDRSITAIAIAVIGIAIVEGSRFRGPAQVAVFIGIPVIISRLKLTVTDCALDF